MEYSHNKVAVMWLVIYMTAYVYGCHYRNELPTIEGFAAVIAATIFSVVAAYYSYETLAPLLGD